MNDMRKRDREIYRVLYGIFIGMHKKSFGKVNSSIARKKDKQMEHEEH